MKVSELIAELQKYDPDARVVIDGYEGGVGDLDRVTTLPVNLNVNTAFYYGEHEEAHGEADEVAVYLPR